MSDELDMVIDVLMASGLREPALTFDERRSWLASSAPDEPPAGASVEQLTLGGRPAERICADGTPGSGTILWLHGGAFTAGGLRSHRGFAANLSRRSGAAVVLLDYRLAPEDPFPAALEDAVGALGELCSEGVSPGTILIGGDSAGGGLALSTVLTCRDRGEPVPGGVIALSPWVDLAMTSPSYETEEDNDPLCSRASLEVSAAAYLGDHDRTDPRCSPLYGQLVGLPPLLVHVGTREVLRDEAIQLIAEATAAGVEVTSWVAPGMVHCWHLFAGIVPESDAALADVGTWAKAHLER